MHIKTQTIVGVIRIGLNIVWHSAARQFMHQQQSSLPSSKVSAPNTMSFKDLSPGDDVEYFSSSSESSCFGRIIAVNELTYTVNSYDLHSDPLAVRRFDCLELNELHITSSIVQVAKASVTDVIFVLTPYEVSDQIVSVAGISNLYFIRYQVTAENSVAHLLTTWISFRMVFPLSYPYLIFKSIISIQAAIVRMLNNRRMSQNNRASMKLPLSQQVFAYCPYSWCHRNFHMR